MPNIPHHEFDDLPPRSRDGSFIPPYGVSPIRQPEGFLESDAPIRYRTAGESNWSPQPVKRVSKRGVAITALVLGLVALCLCPIPILNNVGVIAGFLGAIFGIVGLFGTSKATAAVGLACAVGGVVFSLMFQAQWSAELDKLQKDLDSIVIPTYTLPTP
jgi:hypothetical protein